MELSLFSLLKQPLSMSDVPLPGLALVNAAALFREVVSMSYCNERKRPDDTVSPAIDEILARLGERFNEALGERLEAPARVAELLALPSGQRELAARTREALRTPAVAELLIAPAASPSPQASLDLARLAVAVTERLDPSRYIPSLVCDLRAQAWARLGEARLLAGDLRGAEEALDKAEQLLEDGSADPLEEAHLLEARAAVAGAFGEAGAAAELLEMAAELYESVAEDERAARARAAAAAIEAA
jgi:hypothetical protein